MALSVEMITVDCADPQRLAQWWADAVGGSPMPIVAGEFVVVRRPTAPHLGFQRVAPGKNRVHLDFTAADMDAEVARLAALGATETARHDVGGGLRWVVLADPDGNAFCVAAPRG